MSYTVDLMYLIAALTYLAGMMLTVLIHKTFSEGDVHAGIIITMMATFMIGLSAYFMRSARYERKQYEEEKARYRRYEGIVE